MLAYGAVPRFMCGVDCPFSPTTTPTFAIHNVRFTSILLKPQLPV
jgi:hypothetical protein